MGRRGASTMLECFAEGCRGVARCETLTDALLAIAGRVHHGAALVDMMLSTVCAAKQRSRRRFNRPSVCDATVQLGSESSRWHNGFAFAGGEVVAGLGGAPTAVGWTAIDRLASGAQRCQCETARR